MSTPLLHKAQVSILRTLRHSPSARYTTLMRPTGMESDTFKFHLRKLIHQKYVQKLETGIYELTPVGKEFANNLSKTRPTVQKQPKLSIVIVASRKLGPKTEYLFQERLRSPFYGFWSCISGPVQWGESIEETAARELEKQAGLTATFRVSSFYRKSDYESASKALLEDKLFAVVEATIDNTELFNTYPRGKNAWMTIEELKSQDKYFTSTCNFIDMLESGEAYRAKETEYEQDDY